MSAAGLFSVSRPLILPIVLPKILVCGVPQTKKNENHWLLRLQSKFLTTTYKALLILTPSFF